ncbi:MAG TPA: hypothetical protein VIQ11_08585, partial [Mycobacterium sp.]
NALFRARCDGPSLVQLLVSFIVEALVRAFIFRVDVRHWFSKAIVALIYLAVGGGSAFRALASVPRTYDTDTEPVRSFIYRMADFKSAASANWAMGPRRR